jgi:peptidyl-prolyl cis-trans isomerase SurA
VSVASEEVDEIAGRIAASRGTVQRQLAEIFLAVDNPAQEDDVRRNAERLIEQLRAGAKFPALARQFSQSATAARGGDLGWIQEGQLAPEIDRALAQMKPGQISVPIRSLSGFHIVWLRDERKLSAGDVLLDLKQVLFALPADASTDLQRQVESKARSVRSEIDGCDGVDDLAAEIGSPGSGDLGTVKLGDLPSDLQSTVQGLALGEPSAPVPVSGGLAVLLVCKRTDSGIDRERIREQLVGQRVDNLARRFMRDLRRSANVDIRI